MVGYQGYQRQSTTAFGENLLENTADDSPANQVVIWVC